MTLAVLADVHGNLPALEAVAADVAVQRPERIVVNGDMVNRGPEGVAVMQLLEELGWPMTLGNHDDLMRLWVDRDASLPSTWFSDPFWEATAWCAERLRRAGWIERLAELPFTASIAPPDTASVLVSHGSPRHYREGYGEHLSDEAISEITQMHPADVLVGSHTHRPLLRRWGRFLVLNTGAVGTPFNGDPRAQYLLLHAEDGAWRPEFRAVPYDRARALRAFERDGYLSEGGISARIFFLEVATARSFLVPFLMWSEQQGTPPGLEGWQRFRRVHDDRFRAPDAAGEEALRIADAALTV